MKAKQIKRGFKRFGKKIVTRIEVKDIDPNNIFFPKGVKFLAKDAFCHMVFGRE